VSQSISCGDYAWPNLSHDFILQLIAELGFTSVDVALFSGYSVLSPEVVLADPKRAADSLLRATSSRNLSITGTFGIPDMGLVRMSVNSPDPNERELAAKFFTDLLDFTVRVGCDHLTLLPGTTHPGEPLEQSLERCVTELGWRVDAAAAAGVRFAIEPHTGSILENPANALLLVQAVPGLTLRLDYGHFVCAGVDQLDVDALIPYATVLDCRGGRPGKVQTRLADNQIDFARIVGQLEDRSFDGHYCVEYVHDDRPGCRDCDNLQEAREFRQALESWIVGSRP